MSGQHDAPAGGLAGARNGQLGGRSTLMLTHRGEQPGLFPEAAARTDAPSIEPFGIGTRGRSELGVQCPGCREIHRHNRPGLRRGPCGARYYLVTEAHERGEWSA
ncbi:hypothetical protein [Streptomyces sp. NBC_01262]|uniref:hypothetical protein n=1 Tax=Streptomyces sp. NBC_01262 TaxID=2903803 RepID=UPI002E36E698|nr:hypothetical protein [Streptomyces sp. NBC_01262]